MLKKKVVLPSLAVLLILGGSFGYYLYFRGGERPEAFAVRPVPEDAKGKFVFLSDTQSPLWVETLVIEETDNEKATDRLFKALLAEGPLAAIFHLGDLTAVGSSGRAWRHIDRQLEKVRAARIPFYPALGNHDYLFSAYRGLENFYHRFPYCRPSWYCVEMGGIAVVILNSNFDKLSEEERANQQAWYEGKLAALENAPHCRMVLVACHYPPFTNSTVIEPSEEVRDTFVPPFLSFPKCRLFLSGHSHAFEHFIEQGKDFLVLGGGGGLLHPLLQGNEQRWRDRFPIKTETRLFHYLRCVEGEGDLEVTCRMLEKDFLSFEEVYRIQVNYP
jgi:hypothetical protein